MMARFQLLVLSMAALLILPAFQAAAPAQHKGDDAERSGSPNVEKMKDIALNSREVRLVGPNQQEVEMKDDLQSKVVVALENLQKEAKEVYGQVNEKLDQGWTELKSMVEGVVKQASKSG